jgi:hypothetical protein
MSIGSHEEGAHELAVRIRAYWTSRGADIKVWIEKVGQQHDGKAAVYGVRSDIGLCLPPGAMKGRCEE